VISPVETPVLVNQKALQTALRIGKWQVDERIRRFPPGSPYEFPVEYLGRWRRFNVAKVRAWFAWESAGFTGSPPC